MPTSKNCDSCVPNIRSEYFRITATWRIERSAWPKLSPELNYPTNGISRPSAENTSKIFTVMLHLHGMREDTKMWAKMFPAHAKKCSRIEASVAEGRWVGHERGITGRFEVRRAYEYSAESTAQYPWVLWGSLEGKYVNL